MNTTDCAMMDGTNTDLFDMLRMRFDADVAIVHLSDVQIWTKRILFSNEDEQQSMTLIGFKTRDKTGQD